VLVTRPEPDGRAFAAAIEAAWPGAFDCWFLPLLQIEPEKAPLSLEGVQGLLFTSANGVRAFAAATPVRDIPALCVGEGTAAAARAAGFAAESAQGDAGALARLAAAGWLPGGGEYLHVRGRDTAGDLAGALGAEGIPVREVVLYDARPLAAVPQLLAEALQAGVFNLILVFSPRTARIFAGFAEDAATAGRGWALRRATALAISRAAAAPLEPLGFGAVAVAETPDRAGMLAALGRFVRA
jgi:uroporphyrinogen-III synthase